MTKHVLCWKEDVRPVGGGSQADALGAELQGEDLGAV